MLLNCCYNCVTFKILDEIKICCIPTATIVILYEISGVEKKKKKINCFSGIKLRIKFLSFSHIFFSVLILYFQTITTIVCFLDKCIYSPKIGSSKF